MRSIVALFALGLAGCGSFAVEQPDVPADKDPSAAVTPKGPAPSPTPTTPATNQNVDTGAPGATATDLAPFAGAQLFKPARTPAPGLVVLHGEEGGSDAAYRDFARDMADRGFVVVAMCWFGCSGRPGPSDAIAVDAIADVGKFLKASPDTTGTVGVFGWGRGAEAALVLTASAGVDPFAAVAIYAGTDVVVSRWTWNNTAVANGARIPVETYRGPMLVSHGSDDEVWSYDRAANIIQARDMTPALETQMKFFANEGHTLRAPDDQTALRERVGAFFWEHLGT